MLSEPNKESERLTRKTIFSIGANRLASVPGVFWLVPICIVLLTTRYIFTNADSSWYLIYGRMMADGHGYASDLLGPHIKRGPLFPLIIAGILHFFGLKLELIGYVTRIFYMLNLLVLYGIGSRLYGRLAGFFVFFLALTSFTIHKTTPYILLDHVLPFFFLLSILTMILAVQTRKAIFPLAAGVFLGLAFLTKESALMYLPLFCLLLLQRRYPMGKRLIRTALAYIGFGVVTAPWIAHVVGNSPTIKDALINLMGGDVRLSAASNIVQSTEAVGVLDRIGSILDSIINYHIHTVTQDFAIAPLFLVGVVLLIVTLLVRKRFTGGEIILSALILTSPLNAHLGSHTMRTGQSITYYYLLLAGCSSIIGCGVALFQTWKSKATVLPQLYKIAAWGLPILLAITIIVFQLHQEKGFVEAIQGKGPYGVRYYQSPKMELTGILGPAQLEAAKWSAERITPNDKILVSGTLWGPMVLGGLSKDQLHFIWLHPGVTVDPQENYMSGVSLPFLIIDPFGNAADLTLDYQRRRFAPYLEDNDFPFFVFTLPALPDDNCINAKGSIHSNPHYYCGIWFFLEKMFLNFIHDRNIQYIAVAHTNGYFNEYLKRNKGFGLEFKDERPTGSVFIYRVKAPQPLEEPFLMVGDQVPVFLERLNTYYPGKYERFRREVLVDFLHLTPDQIHQVLSGEGKTFKTY